MAAKPDPEVAAANAELAAAHAESAQEAADKAERDLAEATKEKASNRLCPNCNTEMHKHDNPANPHTYGAWHCDGCGGCWRGNNLREGVSLAGWPKED